MYVVKQHREATSHTLLPSTKHGVKQPVGVSMQSFLQTGKKSIDSLDLQLKKYGLRRKITKKVEKGSDMDDSATLQELHSEFILMEDAIRIAQYTIEQDCAISIRQTGHASLARLRQGAGTKPHTILDKSFKSKTASIIANGMNLAYQSPESALRKVLENFNLPMEMEGHVPHWVSENIIDGFYLTSKGYNYCHGNRQLHTKIRDRYLVMQGCRGLIRKNKSKWHECFLTGDYDVHDIVKFSKFNRENQGVVGVNYPRIPKASDIHSYKKTGDTGMLRDLNERMNYDEDQKRFQHGAQKNYLDYAIISSEKIVSDLLKPDFPIALCDRGNWSIIKNEEQLRNWYEKDAVIPYGWE